MEQSDKKIPRKTHPKETSSFLSNFLFCWELPIFFRGWSKEFTEDDLYETPREHQASGWGDKLEKCWLEEENKKVPSLFHVLVRVFGLEFFWCWLTLFPVDLIVVLLQPICLGKIVDYFSNEELVSKREAYMFVGCIITMYISQALFFHSTSLRLSALGMKVRIGCCSLVYRKFIKMKTNFTTGQLINLISNDVSRLNDGSLYACYGIGSSLKFLIAICFMDVTLGHSAIVGIVLFMIGFLIQLFLSKKLSITRMDVAQKTDRRVRFMNDIIHGIQIIKMYAWEKSFGRLIEMARDDEVDSLSKANTIRILLDTFRQYFPRIAIFLCVLTTILTKSNLTPQYFFALNSIYNNLNVTVLLRVYMSLISYAECKTSLQRIQKFLLSGSSPIFNCTTTDFPGVYLQNIDVKFGDQTILKNANFCATPGEVVGLVGVTGSGKSTLLKVILKETEISNGTINIGGTLSYSSQESWIFPGSIRQNILFGEDMDEKKYSDVVKVCALEHDLSLFPNGDLTLVGERGVMLSGGQKARINLARAIYKDADIYLLDDPLSAVDANVAQHIFSRCILTYLRNKCVILVTHQVKFLTSVSKVYFINEGSVSAANLGELGKIEDDVANLPLPKSEAPLEVKEHRSSGVSNKQTYKQYFTAGTHWMVPFLLVTLFIITQIINTAMTYFVAFWFNFRQTLSTNNFLYIYASLSVILTILCHTQLALFVKFCGRISKNLHQTMFNCILSTNVKFFGDHASGRILNRFTQDLGNIDENIPLFLEQLSVIFLTVVSIVIVLTTLNYWLLIPSVVLFSLFYFFSCVSERINSNIRRSEGIAQSPIFTHLVVTIQGITTIRASKKENLLVKEFDEKQDIHSSAFYLFKAMFFAFTFWVDLTCACYSAIVMFSFFFFKNASLPGNVGLAISKSGLFVGLVQFGMKVWTDLDAQMTSVERVVEYSRLPSEVQTAGKFIPKFWPQFGNIIFKSVSMRYSPEKPLVLNNINLSIQSGEKIGIVGRTGAGKSSLISALFRLYDFEGNIFIDGTDTKTIALSLLRSSISIIPQDPVLFLGTLRRNLDPFDECSDFQIWSVLERLHLKKLVASLPLGLECLVEEDGSNFSVGQKQLLCMARAMLRVNKIVIFDEATASIDLETDEFIQYMIREKFRDCTVLTIAHRLSTVMDSDKILVIDRGEVVEFGEPRKLLQDVDGVFYKLVRKN